MVLCPVPKSWEKREGTFPVPEELQRELEQGVNGGSRARLESAGSKAGISFQQTGELPAEGYHLGVSPEGIEVRYTEEAGCFYALVTLRQMVMQAEGSLACCRITDAPDFPVRGIMVDISRNKIPTLKTLENLADLFAGMKFNHMELYLEGLAFAYPSFERLWKDPDDSSGKNMPFTGEEIRSLDEYCKERFIDLTPNQNCLGHMAAWLTPEGYPNLAERPEGGQMMGFPTPPGTLDPSDPGSIRLVERMTDDLLANFTSRNFNVDMDEPFELGQGKSRERVEQEGMGKVYLDYMLKIYDMVKRKGKHMLLWGDILTKHPETLPSLPKDITVLDWNYDAVTPFEGHARLLSESGAEFLLCAGTGAWGSFTGRTENMLYNIRDAAVSGKKYGAKGLLLTDWGDGGHMNPLPVSYPAYAYGASVAWNVEGGKDMPLEQVLDSLVFLDRAGVMGRAVLELGRYQQFEEYPMANRTLAGAAFLFCSLDKSRLAALTKKLAYATADMICDPAGQKRERELLDAADGIYRYEELAAFLDKEEAWMQKQEMGHPEQELITKEYRMAVGLTRFCAELRYCWLSGRPVPQDAKRRLRELKELLSETWLARNKERGLSDTLRMFDALEKTL